MNDQTSIKERIRKMLALAAEKSGATEDERMTAMQMASALMARHGIERAEISDSEPSKAIWGTRNAAALNAYQVELAKAAGFLYGCTPAFYNRGKNGFVFIGRQDNIDAAEMTVLWLMKQIDEIYKATYKRGMVLVAEQGKWRRDFKLAASYRVARRAYDYVTNPVLLSQATGKTALVVADYFKRLQEENQAATAGKTNAMKPSKFKLGYDAAIAGRKAGDKVKLHRQIENA